MKLLRINSTFLALATGAALCTCSASGNAQVVINEFAYDDAGTDDLEFIELFNPGLSTVDIGGWVLGGFDSSGANTSAIIPGGTMLAPGGFYVFGNTAIVPKNQTIAGGFLENDMETIELRDSLSVLQDQVTYEGNKATHPAPPEGRLWGNSSAPQGLPGTPTFTSQSRYLDGRDTGNNARDFGMRRGTPGAANSIGIRASYTGPDVDLAVPESNAAEFHGSFVAPRVINPTVVSASNPNAIPASPQGGNAVIAWDPSGGGNTAGSDFTMGVNSFFDIFVYVDPTLTTGVDTEEWAIGLAGTEDATFQNLFAGGVNGTTGVGWVFNRDSAAATLKLIDFGPGGTNTSYVTLGSIALGAGDKGWHRLSLDIEGTAVTGTFDATTILGATASDLLGNLYIDYREGLTANDTARPPTFDLVPEPGTVSLLVCGGLLLLGGAYRRVRRR